MIRWDQVSGYTREQRQEKRQEKSDDVKGERMIIRFNSDDFIREIEVSEKTDESGNCEFELEEMTLDEAIRHCDEIAKLCGDDDEVCALEHKQLAKWLRELRELRKVIK